MPEDVKKAIEEFMTGFEEFKAANDERLAQIEAKGAEDPVTTAKLNEIEKHLIKFEDLNQELTKTLQAQERMTAQLDEIREQADMLETAMKRISVGDNDNEDTVSEYVKAFGTYLRTAEDGDVPREVIDVLKEVQADLKTKGLITQDDTAGGYYVVPPETEASILKTVVEMSPARSVARVTTIGGRELILPKRTGTFSASRVSEVGTRSETSGYATGQTTINAPEMFAYVPISNQMLEDSRFNLEGELMMEFGEQFAVLEGTEFVSGNENDELEGIAVNAAIIAACVASGSAAALTADGLIDLYHTLKTFYAKNGTFLLNRTTLGSVRKLKDGSGAYIWQPGLVNGLPNSILGRPYVEFPDMPDVAASAYPIAFGDFLRGYRIADRTNLSVLRDPYTLANNGQVKFLARRRVGGKVVMPEAIKLQKVAAG